jgi:uncharacterized protein (DUF1015 family)
LADVKPFICCRPLPAQASEVAALPYDVFSRPEAAAEIAAHPQSFLRIDKTAALFPLEVDEYDERVYARAAALFAAELQDGSYVCEEEPRYFLYRIEKDGRAQTGVVACVAVDDYEQGVLRRHENTRAHKLEDRVQHITALDAQTGPVFVAYRAQEAIDAAVQAATAAVPLYDFVAPDAVRHTVWRVDDSSLERAIQEGFAGLDALYIADGHHRAAAAARIGASRRACRLEAKIEEGGEERACGDESDHFLIIAFPSNQLAILDYNRVVCDTNGLSRDELLARISECFSVEPVDFEHCRPRVRGEFAMYLEGAWYRLVVREDLRLDDPVAGLDASLLQDMLLAPVLGIEDPRVDNRISYVGGVRGLEELARRADAGAGQGEGHGLAFALFPCSLEELFAVADAGLLMPPKSTWFEPKPRSGLFIHRMTR